MRSVILYCYKQNNRISNLIIIAKIICDGVVSVYMLLTFPASILT